MPASMRPPRHSAVHSPSPAASETPTWRDFGSRARWWQFSRCWSSFSPVGGWRSALRRHRGAGISPMQRKGQPRRVVTTHRERESTMTAQFTQRLGAAAGMVYAILLMTAGAVGSPTSQPAFAMEVLAFTLFLFFLGSLSSAMRLAEGGGGALSTTAFGAGLDVDHDQAG